ncbi:hypothetical protein, partial [Lysinibacillus sp. NPDC056185]|uniref:hypothetical protein n=1 Tax=Lysinibacillus sp. NPDC056185 TaxID=3345739 RepID=UPI0039EFF681
SAIFSGLSAILSPLSAIFSGLSAILSPLSAIFSGLSAILSPLSAIQVTSHHNKKRVPKWTRFFSYL